MIHFVVGTRAQLFKMAPIMLECNRRKLEWRWIYTAQHKETIEQTLTAFNLPEPDHIVMQWENEAKTMRLVFYWFAKMLGALVRSKKILGKHKGKEHIVLTHGDTLTTVWGALLGRLNRTKVMHVESGLRSFNLLKPFPEEISRLITFRLSNYYACPGQWAVDNLKKYKGTKINTQENTQIDTIRFGLRHSKDAVVDIPKKKYVVVSIHRYENIFRKERFEKIIDEIEFIAQHFHIAFIQHPATQIQLDKLNLRGRLDVNPNITLMPRLEYLPFIKIAKGSEFTVVDGGGNQEEFYHMGKPTLIFRNETERKEGLRTTAVISKVEHGIIEDFVRNYKDYEHKETSSTLSPSAIIVDTLEKEGFGKDQDA